MEVQPKPVIKNNFIQGNKPKPHEVNLKAHEASRKAHQEKEQRQLSTLHSAIQNILHSAMRSSSFEVVLGCKL